MFCLSQTLDQGKNKTRDGQRNQFEIFRYVSIYTSIPWKFIFLLFYVYYKFSVMNMYFLNQENKTKKNWRRSVFTNAGSSFFLLNYHFSFD